MAPCCRRKEQGSINKKGAWTADEDAKLSDYIDIHASSSNPKKWKTIAVKSGVNRSGKSCRLRWLNYLRPNIKRGNISDDEEDLIIRLHNLLGNRWSLIAGRIPGRTDNEIKNYWNSYLSKKLIIKQKKKDDEEEEEVETPSSKGTATDQPSSSSLQSCKTAEVVVEEDEGENYDQFRGGGGGGLDFSFDDDDDLFDFSDIGTLGLDWVDNFLKLDDQVQLDTKDELPRQ